MIPAVITASVAVLVAIATQLGTSVRARTDRVYAARRAALVDAQDRALAVRLALLRYGRELPASITRTDLGAEAEVLPALEEERVRTSGEFTVSLSRVEDVVIARALQTWFGLAERRFVDVRDVSAATEQAWFEHVDSLVGAALKHPACRTTDKSIAAIPVPDDAPAEPL